MTIRKVLRIGHPLLLERAEEIDDPGAPEISALLEDMKDTLEQQQGIGLAAPQIGVSKRMVIFFVPKARANAEENTEEAVDVPMTVLINPVIEALDDEVSESFESCLSVPGLTGLVPRHHRIRYSGLNEKGIPFAREAEGFHARVVQHECDHLDGILYPMRIEDMREFGFLEEMKEAFGDEEDDAEEREEES